MTRFLNNNIRRQLKGETHRWKTLYISPEVMRFHVWTRDLLKKIRDTKGIFHAKMGTIKDRNGMDLTEAEDIKKRYPVCLQYLLQCQINTVNTLNRYL